MSLISLHESDHQAKVDQAKRERQVIQMQMDTVKEEILEARRDKNESRTRSNSIMAFFTNVLGEMTDEIGECTVTDANWLLPNSIFHAESVGDKGNDLQQEVLAGFNARDREIRAIAQLDVLKSKLYAAEEAVGHTSGVLECIQGLLQEVDRAIQ